MTTTTLKMTEVGRANGKHCSFGKSSHAVHNNVPASTALVAEAAKYNGSRILAPAARDFNPDSATF